MIRSTTFSISSILDETTEVVRRIAPWCAIVVTFSLPFRVLQVSFIEQLLALRSDAQHHGNALHRTAWWLLAAFLLSLTGRALHARASRLGLSTSTFGWRELLQIRPAALACYFYAALLASVFSHATLLLVVLPALASVFGGLAAGTMELNERPSLTEPLRLISRNSRRWLRLIGLFAVFFIGCLIAFINLYAAFAAVLWLFHAFSADLTRWDLLLQPTNPHFMLLLAAGAVLAVEPFWITANVITVARVGAEESGEDLFLELRKLALRRAS